MSAGQAFLAATLARAAAARRHVVFAEGDDSRVRAAAGAFTARGLGRATLLGGPDCAAWAAREAPGVAVCDPSADPGRDRIAAHLLARKPEKAGGSLEAARARTAEPLLFAAGMVALGLADATVGGAVHTTADVLRAAFWAVGPAQGIRAVSSAFYMVLPVYGVLTFADCGVVQYPSAEDLAEIALAAVRDRRRIVGDAPRVAFLSHGTRGSAEGESIARVREAVGRFRTLAPDVPADGELQADAALVPEVAERKAADGPLRGRANVLVFPDLDSGNIAYKLVQRLAGATAIGPIVQGLARPCCDLSRGAAVEDIVLAAAIASLQADHP